MIQNIPKQTAETMTTYHITGRVYSYGKLPEGSFRTIREKVESLLNDQVHVVSLKTMSSNENSYSIDATVSTSLTPASVKELFEEVTIKNDTIQLFPSLRIISDQIVNDM